MLTTLNIDIQAMLVWLTLPFYDFYGFRSVAVNSVYKLQFLHLSRSSSEGTWLTVCCYLFTAVESCSHGNSGKRYNQNMDSQPVPIKMRKRCTACTAEVA